jgi:pyrimidine operon attenuation protein/uracil phosphoribosyltransferase
MGDSERRICSQDEIREFLERVATAILDLCPDPSQLAFIGIRSRGVHLARRLRDRVASLKGDAEIPLGAVDITLYRDDLDEIAPQPVVRQTDLPFNVTGRFLVLVDDVLFTGRTARAALDQLIDFGRPRVVKLVVLVDRGNRELPIQPDFVGKTIETHAGEDVEVRVQERDGRDEVVLLAANAAENRKSPGEDDTP